MKEWSDTPVVGRKEKSPMDAEAFLRSISGDAGVQSHPKEQAIFSQGDGANSIFYICSGQVRLTVFSSGGKAATITVLADGDFLGEECLAEGRSLRPASAVAVTDCSLIKIDKHSMRTALNNNHALASFFMDYLLECKIRVQRDLADQLSMSNAKRIVRLPPYPESAIS